jgi:hypothetical protein
MPQTLPNNENIEEVKKAIMRSMAFFSLYELPISLINIHQYLYKIHSSYELVEKAVSELVSANKLVRKNELYSIREWDHGKFESNKAEIIKRWKKVNRYFWLLSLIPYVHQVSVINSLALGNAHQESDIDFFVVTKPNRLYFVRSIIIVLFRTLRVYKTREHINQRFCFGFYVTSNHLSLSSVLLPDDDPHFAFWFASFAPVLNKKGYEELVLANPWIYTYFPNFDFELNLTKLKKKNLVIRLFKAVFEIIFMIPVILTEPILRSIHVRHTFNLPENHWPTSTTVANSHMLKLHALDPRKEMRRRFYELLQTL